METERESLFQKSTLALATMASRTIFSKAQEAANFLRERLDPRLQKPKVAIVCGSGLGGLADAVHEQPRVEIEYSSIPYFPQSTGMSLFFLTGHSMGGFL